MASPKIKNELKKYLPTAAGLALIAAIVLIYFLVISPMIKYSDATAAMDKEDYEKAIEIFGELGNYKESKSLYEQAVMLYNYKHGLDITGNYVEFDANDLENSYLRAKSYIANKKYDKAATILRLLGNYKDSSELLKPYRYYGLSEGTPMTIGSWEQDNDNSNGKEPLNWTVISCEDGRLLLLCDSVIDFMPFDKDGNSSWKDSDIRKFLSEDFYGEAFSDEEKLLLSEQKTETPANPQYEGKDEPSCNDKVFLLSIQEFKNYTAKVEIKRSSAATPYAQSKGCHIYTKEKGGETLKGSWFWLRSTGFAEGYNSVCYSSGEVSYGGQESDISLGVRPAIWIGLNTEGDGNE